MHILILYHHPKRAEKIRLLTESNQFHCRLASFESLSNLTALLNENNFSAVLTEHAPVQHRSLLEIFGGHFPTLPLIAYGTSSQEQAMLNATGSIYWDFLLSSNLHAATIRKTLLSNLKRVDIMEKARSSEVLIHKVMDYSNRMLARISHEVRTPMNAVIGMAEMLYDTCPDSKQRLYIETIRESGVQVLTLFNDLLDFSNIESGNINIHNQPFDLRDFLNEIIVEVMEQARRKRLELLFYIEPSLPKYFVGDVVRLRQVIMHLLENALKFTLQGWVCIRAYRCENNKIQNLCIEVEDSGAGISKKQIPSLFKPYVDSLNEKDSIKGIGLGLMICDRLTKQMNGSIEVHSQLDKGSRFVVQLPWNPTKNTRDIRPKAVLKGKTALYISHDKLLDTILSDYLHYNHMQLDIRQLDQDLTAIADWIKSYDLLITHLRTNIKIDLKLIDAIRAFNTIPHLLIKDREKTSDKLIVIRKDTVVLPKPLEYTDLIESMAAVLEKKADRLNTIAQDVLPDEHLAEYHPLDILVADDNVINQRIIMSTLNRYGYQVKLADNGKEAIESLERRTYDLVLMDIQMPVLDGITATQIIRKKISKKKQPHIIALTVGQMQAEKTDYLQYGFNDVWLKPVPAKMLPQLLMKIPRLEK